MNSLLKSQKKIRAYMAKHLARFSTNWWVDSPKAIFECSCCRKLFTFVAACDICGLFCCQHCYVELRYPLTCYLAAYTSGRCCSRCAEIGADTFRVALEKKTAEGRRAEKLVTAKYRRACRKIVKNWREQVLAGLK